MLLAYMFIADYSIKFKITAGWFASVVIRGSRLYASNSNSKEILIFEYAQTWSKVKSVASRSQPTNLQTLTLALTEQRLIACSSQDNQCYFYTTLGESVGQHEVKLDRPYICGSYSDDSVLIADQGNHRLVVMNEQGELRALGLQPQVPQPRGAVLVKNELFVTSGSSKTIYQYNGRSTKHQL